MKNNLENNLPVVNLYKKRNLKSEISTQLIYGDHFKILKKLNDWSKIKIINDRYTGYIKNKNFPKTVKPNFKVSSLKAKVFYKPKINMSLNKQLPFGSKIRITEKKGKFVKFRNYWIKLTDIKPIKFKNNDVFSNIKMFKNIKYKWGGKSYMGIDCSALIQILLNFNGNYCPRDTKDQVNYFKKNVSLKKIKKNDLIFWKGHVAVAISKSKLIHAYGPYKKVVIMPIKKTIKRIYKTAKLRVVCVKRPL